MELCLLIGRKGQLGECLQGSSYVSCEGGLAKKRLDNVVDVAGHPTNVMRDKGRHFNSRLFTPHLGLLSCSLKGTMMQNQE